METTTVSAISPVTIPLTSNGARRLGWKPAKLDSLPGHVMGVSETL